MFGWFLNGDGDNTPEAQARGVKVISDVDEESGDTNSTLTIPATMDNDNITVSCQSFGDNVPPARSPDVCLRVQGKHN